MDDLSTKTPYSSWNPTKCSPNVVAGISNSDLKRPLNELVVPDLKGAFAEHGVLFFCNQKISFDHHAQSMRAS